MSKKWDRRYLEMAYLVGTWSKDPGSHVGAVVVGDFGQILSTGYNGFPRSIEDRPERLSDRETKLKFTLHAETNCVYNASLTGTSLLGTSIYVAGLPICHECAKAIIQAGISRVVLPRKALGKSKTWDDSWSMSMDMFNEAGVEVDVIDV